MLIYFVRHGQSEGNKNQFYQRWNTPLSEEGVNQAKILAKRLKNVRFDLIYTSNIMRARQTAEIIGKHKIPIEIWKEIKEIRSPTEIKGKKVDNPFAIKIKERIKMNISRRNWKYSDEETFEEVNLRAENILKHLLRKHKHETVLCVSHSSILKAIMGKVIFGKYFSPEIFMRMKDHMWAKNTGVTICEYSEKYGWTLNTWSDSSHLK